MAIYSNVLFADALSTECLPRDERLRARTVSMTEGAQPLCHPCGVVKLFLARPYRPLPPWQAIGACPMCTILYRCTGPFPSRPR